MHRKLVRKADVKVRGDKIGAEALAEARPRERKRRHRPLIMIVEDDPEERGIYGTILCYNGFDVVLVPDGAAALGCADRYRPDLIVLDLGLSDADGLTVCRALGERASAPRVPVIALSGAARSRLQTLAREAGCVRYVEKPTHPVNVLHRIEEILGRPPAAGDGAQPRIIPFV